VKLYECEFPANLYKFELTDFGIILEMDWLSRYQPQIDFSKQKITLRGPNGETVVQRGQRPRMGIRLVSALRAHQLLGNGCEGFLCHAVRTESVGPSLEDIPVAREFPDIFPDEIPGMPPLREVEFCIDVAPGATLISKAPYQMPPAELKELKLQLEELLEKGYIHLVRLHGEPQSYL